MTPACKNAQKTSTNETLSGKGDSGRGDSLKQNNKVSHSGHTLRDSVTSAMDDYFKHLDGELTTDIYQMVMTQVESALLASVMKHVKGNQSKAALCLGISRGTLLKKLTQYKLHPCKKRG